MSAVFYENKVQKGTVKAVFEHLDTLVNAIDEIKKAKLGHDMIVTSPFPVMTLSMSSMRRSTKLLFAGSLLPAHFRWNHGICTAVHHPPKLGDDHSSRKATCLYPAFLVIHSNLPFFGDVFSLSCLLLMCRLPLANLQVEVQDPRLSDDKFGFVLNSLKASEAAKAMEILSKYAPLELINGNDQEKAPQVVIPLEERRF